MQIAAAISALFVPVSLAHMKMKFPIPRGTPGYPLTGPADYDLSSPIGSAGMCHGKAPGQVTATYKGIHMTNNGNILYSWRYNQRQV